MERLLNAKELASVLGTRANTVYDLAAAGELLSLKVPGVGRRFRESEVAAWLDRCRNRPTTLPLELVGARQDFSGNGGEP